MPLQGTVATKDNERKQFVEASVPILYGGAMPTLMMGTVQYNDLSISEKDASQQVVIGVSCNSHQKPGGSSDNAWTNVYFRLSSNSLSQETKGANETNAIRLNTDLRPGTPVAICFLPSVGEDGNPRQYTKKETLNGQEVTAVYSDFGGYVRILWISIIGNKGQVDAAVAAYEAAQAEREAKKAGPGGPVQTTWAQQPAMSAQPTAPVPAPMASPEPEPLPQPVVEAPAPAPVSPNRWRQGN